MLQESWELFHQELFRHAESERHTRICRNVYLLELACVLSYELQLDVRVGLPDLILAILEAYARYSQKLFSHESVNTSFEAANGVVVQATFLRSPQDSDGTRDFGGVRL